MVVGIHRRLRAQLGQLCALLLGAVSQMLNGGAMVRAGKSCCSPSINLKNDLRRHAVGVGVEPKAGAPKDLAIGAQRGLRHHPDALVAVEIAGRTHLGEP